MRIIGQDRLFVVKEVVIDILLDEENVVLGIGNGFGLIADHLSGHVFTAGAEVHRDLM
jgi:hypothetical protein